MRKGGSIWYSKAILCIVCIVCAGSERIHQRRQSEGGTYSLRLASSIGFSSSNNDFFVSVDSLCDSWDEVCYFCLQDWLLIIPPSDLSRVVTFFGCSVLFSKHLDHGFGRHSRIVGLPSDLVFKKSPSKSCCFFLCSLILFPRNLKFFYASNCREIVYRILNQLDWQFLIAFLLVSTPVLILSIRCQ